MTNLSEFQKPPRATAKPFTPKVMDVMPWWNLDESSSPYLWPKGIAFARTSLGTLQTTTHYLSDTTASIRSSVQWKFVDADPSLAYYRKALSNNTWSRWYQVGESRPKVGSSAPTMAPAYIGEVFVDTVERKPYIAVGMSVTDWVSVLPVAPTQPTV